MIISETQVSSTPLMPIVFVQILTLVCITFLFSCTEKKDKKLSFTEKIEDKELSFTEKIEKSHSKSTFKAYDAIKFDMDLMFGGKPVLKGTMTFSTDSNLGLIALDNGGKIYFNKDKVYCSPDLSAMKRKRFHAYTWVYFMFLPFKLSDPGTKWSDIKISNTADSLEYKKMEFDAGIGDTPKDWYIIFADKKTHLLDHVSYIVTSGKSLEEAEQDPHAIKYMDYKKVQGIPIPHKWSYKAWNPKDGLGKELGSATITDVQFINDFSKQFSIPKDYIEVTK